MLPLHSGHGEAESLVILALALVVVGAAFALTREGWSRVGALVGVAVGAGASSLALWVAGVRGEVAHVLGHGLELSAVVVVALAGYYALFDARTATASEN